MEQSKEVFGAIFSGILENAKSERELTFQPFAETETVQRARHAIEDGQVEQYHHLFQKEFDDFIEGTIESVTNNSDALFLFQYSQFVEQHIEWLIEQYEGSPCCADKSRTIIKGIAKFYLNGTPIAFNYKQEVTYHLPKRILQSHDQIIDLFQGLQQLYYGNPQAYLATLKSITSQVSAPAEQLSEQHSRSD